MSFPSHHIDNAVPIGLIEGSNLNAEPIIGELDHSSDANLPMYVLGLWAYQARKLTF